MIDNEKLRDDMMFLFGQLHAIAFPLILNKGEENSAYYDLIDSIIEQYKSVLNRLFDGVCDG